VTKLLDLRVEEEEQSPDFVKEMAMKKIRTKVERWSLASERLGVESFRWTER